MTDNLEQRAREVLAKAMDDAGFTQTAYDLRRPALEVHDAYMAAVLRAITTALKGQPASSGWEGIETAPRDGAFVDLWVSNSAIAEGGQRVTDAAWLDGAWREYAEWDDDEGYGERLRRFSEIGYTTPVETEFCKATHYMLLPSPPEPAAPELG